MLPTVWCILSHIELDCRFLLVDCAFLICNLERRAWKFQPTNSPPMSWMHRVGFGYRASQVCLNFSVTCWEVFSFINQLFSSHLPPFRLVRHYSNSWLINVMISCYVILGSSAFSTPTIVLAKKDVRLQRKRETRRAGRRSSFLVLRRLVMTSLMPY